MVVPGDRHDVIMAACLAELNGTHLAALLLSAGIMPDPRVWELTQAAFATGLPILVVDDDSYQTATLIGDLDPGLPVDDQERIEGVTDSIADALDVPWLESLPGSTRSRRLSPAAFRYRLVELARAAGACVVLPEGTEPRIVQAAVACAERGIARSVLLGSPEEVARLTRSLGLRLPDGVTVIDPQGVAERYVAPLAQLRQHRGWTDEIAREHLGDPIMVGTMMLQPRRSGRHGRRRRPHHLGHGPPGPADPGHHAWQPPGVVGVLHVPARRGRRLRRLRHQPRPGRRSSWPTSPSRARPQRGPSASSPGSR